MIPIDLSGKIALVTGVGDNESFAWFIAKALQAVGEPVITDAKGATSRSTVNSCGNVPCP